MVKTVLTKTANKLNSSKLKANIASNTPANTLGETSFQDQISSEMKNLISLSVKDIKQSENPSGLSSFLAVSDNFTPEMLQAVSQSMNKSDDQLKSGFLSLLDINNLEIPEIEEFSDLKDENISHSANISKLFDADFSQLSILLNKESSTESLESPLANIKNETIANKGNLNENEIDKEVKFQKTLDKVFGSAIQDEKQLPVFGKFAGKFSGKVGENPKENVSNIDNKFSPINTSDLANLSENEQIIPDENLKELFAENLNNIENKNIDNKINVNRTDSKSLDFEEDSSILESIIKELNSFELKNQNTSTNSTKVDTSNITVKIENAEQVSNISIPLKQTDQNEKDLTSLVNGNTSKNDNNVSDILDVKNTSKKITADNKFKNLRSNSSKRRQEDIVSNQVKVEKQNRNEVKLDKIANEIEKLIGKLDFQDMNNSSQLNSLDNAIVEKSVEFESKANINDTKSLQSNLIGLNDGFESEVLQTSTLDISKSDLSENINALIGSFKTEPLKNTSSNIISAKDENKINVSDITDSIFDSKIEQKKNQFESKISKQTNQSNEKLAQTNSVIDSQNDNISINLLNSEFENAELVSTNLENDINQKAPVDLIPNKNFENKKVDLTGDNNSNSLSNKLKSNSSIQSNKLDSELENQNLLNQSTKNKTTLVSTIESQIQDNSESKNIDLDFAKNDKKDESNSGIDQSDLTKEIQNKISSNSPKVSLNQVKSDLTNSNLSVNDSPIVPEMKMTFMEKLNIKSQINDLQDFNKFLESLEIVDQKGNPLESKKIEKAAKLEENRNIVSMANSENAIENKIENTNEAKSKSNSPLENVNFDKNQNNIENNIKIETKAIVNLNPDHNLNISFKNIEKLTQEPLYIDKKKLNNSKENKIDLSENKQVSSLVTNTNTIKENQLTKDNKIESKIESKFDTSLNGEAESRSTKLNNENNEVIKKSEKSEVKSKVSVNPNENSIMHTNNSKETFKISDKAKTEVLTYTNVAKEEIIPTVSKIASNTTVESPKLVRMVLNPENMGRVFVEISVQNETAKINFKADKKEVNTSIEEGIEELGKLLSKEGLKMEVVVQNSGDSTSTNPNSTNSNNQEQKENLRKNGSQNNSIKSGSANFESFVNESINGIRDEQYLNSLGDKTAQRYMGKSSKLYIS